MAAKLKQADSWSPPCIVLHIIHIILSRVIFTEIPFRPTELSCLGSCSVLTFVHYLFGYRERVSWVSRILLKSLAIAKVVHIYNKLYALNNILEVTQCCGPLRLI